MIHDSTGSPVRPFRPRRSIIGILIATALCVAIAACGDDDPADPGDGGGTFNGTIRVLDNGFSPRTVTISVGDSVTWRWEGSNSHTVSHGTSPTNLLGLFDEGPKSSGTFGYRFTSAGTIPYLCKPHYSMGMTGTITVQP